jgi:glycosyltransferase involved in cell wall biosynthesis
VRIVYLHQYFTTPGMTGGTRSYEIARRLVARGHEVHMVTTDRDATPGGRQGWSTTEVAGIQVHALPVPYSNRMSYARRIGAFMQFAIQAAREASRIGGDLVYATSTPLTIAIPAVRAARAHRIPMVFEVRDLWPQIPVAVGALRNPVLIAMARRLERYAYRNAAHVIALSDGMRDGVVATGHPASRVTVIPNACDREMFDVGDEPGREIRARYEWLGNRPMVVYTGTMGLINGVGYMARIAAAAAAIDPDVRFVVVGDGREAEQVRSEAVTLGILDRNFFLVPPAAKASMPAWLSAATIATSFVIDKPALWANSANKFFDALAAARPIAINYGGWQANEINESGIGLVLDRQRPEVAAAHLVRAVRDDAWLRTARESARRLATERYDRDRLTARLEDVMLRVVGARPST